MRDPYRPADQNRTDWLCARWVIICIAQWSSASRLHHILKIVIQTSMSVDMDNLGDLMIVCSELPIVLMQMSMNAMIMMMNVPSKVDYSIGSSAVWVWYGPLPSPTEYSNSTITQSSSTRQVQFEFWPTPKSATSCQHRNTAKFVAGAKLTHGRD